MRILYSILIVPVYVPQALFSTVFIIFLDLVHEKCGNFQIEHYVKNLIEFSFKYILCSAIQFHGVPSQGWVYLELFIWKNSEMSLLSQFFEFVISWSIGIIHELTRVSYKHCSMVFIVWWCYISIQFLSQTNEIFQHFALHLSTNQIKCIKETESYTS